MSIDFDLGKLIEGSLSFAIAVIPSMSSAETRTSVSADARNPSDTSYYQAVLSSALIVETEIFFVL
jgi:hypothetical protein